MSDNDVHKELTLHMVVLVRR